MLVTCLKCNKPVFVSSSMVSGGEAVIQCNACDAALLVTTTGTVRLPNGAGAGETPAESTGDGGGHVRGVALPERDGDDSGPEVTISQPTTGLGSAGRDECGTSGAGSWSPRVADVGATEITLDMAAPPPSEAPTVEIVATPSGPEPDPEHGLQLQSPPREPPPPPREPPPPPREPPPLPPESPPLPPESSPLPPESSPPPVESSPGESPAESAVLKFEPKPPEPPAPPNFEPAEVPQASESAPELVEAVTAVEPPLSAREPAGELRPRGAIHASVGRPEPGPKPGPAEGPPVSPAANHLPQPGREPGVWEGPTRKETATDPEAAAPEPWDQWLVASRMAEATSGRGTVPMDEAAFRREIHRKGWFRIVAVAVILLVGAVGLWAGGIIGGPGAPVPAVLQRWCSAPEVNDQPVAEVAHLQPVAPEALASTPAPTPLELTLIEPDPAVETSEEDRVRGKRRRKGKRLGSEEAATESEADGTATAPAPATASSRAASQRPASRALARPPLPPPSPPATPAPTAETHYRQGNAYLKEKKVSLAIEEYKACLAQNPRYGLAYRSLGVAYMLLGREKSAIQAYEQFLKTMPAHRDAGKVKRIIADYYSRHP